MCWDLYQTHFLHLEKKCVGPGISAALYYTTLFIIYGDVIYCVLPLVALQ